MLSRLRTIAGLLLAAITVVALLGLPELRPNSHYSAYFEEDAPVLQAHREISATFSRTDSLLVLLQGDRSFLDPENFLLIDELTFQLESHPRVRRVVSVARLGILGENVTDKGDFIPTAGQLEAHGRAGGLLLSEDQTVAGILVFVELPDRSSAAVVRTVTGLKALVEEATAPRGIRPAFSGTLALNEAYINTVRADLRKLLPGLLLLMFVILTLRLRSWATALVLLGIGLLAVLAAFGMAGLAGAELAALHAFTPVIIVAISVAGCVHLALGYGRYRAWGQSPEQAARSSIHRNLLPMALANGTTAAGFLGLLLSPSPPVQVMGMVVASGILVAFGLCLSLLPVFLAGADPVSISARRSWRGAERLAALVHRRRTLIITLFLLLAVPATGLALRNTISDNVFEYFAPSHPFSRDARLVDSALSGVNELHYALDSGRENGFLEAQAVQDLQRFSAWLRTQPEVRRVASAGDLGLIREAQSEGRLQQRLDFFRDAAKTAGSGNDLLALDISRDYAAALVSVYLEPLDSAGIAAFDQRALAWARTGLPGYRVVSGGPPLMFAHLGQQNIQGMLTALGSALLIAALLLGLVFRSLKVAWVAMLCNLLPILLVYSLWALFNGRISLGAAVVMGMILGIVLDDTVYFLSAHQRAAAARVADPVLEAIKRVGPAMIITTLTLVGGLSLGLLSQFGPIWSMSALSVGIIAAALLVDLLLLPALLVQRGGGRAVP